MNKTRNNSLRAWLTALCAAAFCLLGTQTAWGQTTQGVKVGDNVTKVNNVAVTSGEIKGANSGTTVTVTVASPSDGKVAVVTVSPTTIPATSVTALTPSATTVQKDNTFTVTATVSPAYADKLYWTVSNSENAGFVSGSTTVSTLETTVDASTGTTTATLKALASGTVIVSVKATDDEETTELATTEEITINALPPLPPGALPGKFTINADGDQVLFSQGNLQATNGSAWSWAFAANQWDYIGDATTTPSGNGNIAISGNGTVSSNGTVDLFGWSTSATTLGINNSTGNIYTGDFADWGSNATVQAGIGTGWRTLTSAEWLYLFGMEANNADKDGHARYRKYFRATVNSIQGIVVLPDDISGISDIPAESSRGTASTFAGKTYDTSAWATLEAAGCVFLPAAGYRIGTSVSNVGSTGVYWSSTPYDDSNNAYMLYFRSSYVNPAYNNFRYSGYSVRLVQDVVAAP